MRDINKKLRQLNMVASFIYLFISYSDMSPIKNRPIREINKHYFQKEKKKNLKVSKEFWNKKFHQSFNFINHSIWSIIQFHWSSIWRLFTSVLTTLHQLLKMLIELNFNKKNIDNKLDFINHQIKIFVVLRLNINFSYVLLSSLSIVDQKMDASNINTQFIITCFDICSSIPHENFEWSNFDILCSCKNFVNSIFFVCFCVIKLFFIFTKSTCYFIFFWFNDSFCVDEYLNNCCW